MISHDESSLLVEALEALRRVSERDDLIEWAHARLGRLVDLTSMVCLLAEPYGMSFRIRDVIASGEISRCLPSFDREPANDDVLCPDEAGRRATGVQLETPVIDASTALMDRWMRERRSFRIDSTNDPKHADESDIGPLLECFDVGTITAHGVKEAFSGSTTFVMLGTPTHSEPERAVAEVLDLLMPSLHVARQRIYRHERARGGHGSAVGLTAREIKILALIADGKTDEEVAGLTGRSVHTIKNQVRNVISKLGARNRTQATLLAVHHDLLRIG